MQSSFDSIVVCIGIYWRHLAPCDMSKVVLVGTIVSLASEVTKYLTHLSSPLPAFSSEPILHHGDHPHMLLPP